MISADGETSQESAGRRREGSARLRRKGAPEDAALVKNEKTKNKSGIMVRPTPDMELPYPPAAVASYRSKDIAKGWCGTSRTSINDGQRCRPNYYYPLALPNNEETVHLYRVSVNTEIGPGGMRDAQ